MPRRYLTLVFSPFVFQSLFAQSADSLVQRAWTLWNENDRAAVVREFQAALQIEPSNARAHLGLSYFHALNQDPSAAWYQYDKAVSSVPDPAPYIFAAWITEKCLDRSEHYAATVVPLLQSITETPAMRGTLYGAACDRLGEFYESRNDQKKAKRYFDEQHTIDTWALIGPFDNVSASGYDRVFAPETTFDSRATYAGKNGIPASWFSAVLTRPDRWVDLTHYFSTQSAIFYGNTFIHSPVRQLIQLRVGTSGSVKAFINDDIVLAVVDENNNDMDTYIVETVLQEGWNRLLIKCGYSEITACNYKVRLTDLAGAPLNGLRVSADAAPYPHRPGTSARPIDNFAERFFRDRIADHPEHAENYLLLADTYLRNDKAVEAELVLRDALRQWPDCSVIHWLLLEAYARGEKYDEAARTREALQALDPHGPTQLEMRIATAVENESFDEAETVLEEFERLRPQSRAAYEHRISLLAKKQQLQEMLRVVDEACERYPDYWDFTYIKSLFALRARRDPKLAAAAVETYLARRYGTNGLEMLQQIGLESSDLEAWEAYMQRLVDFRPAHPIYAHHRALIYQNVQRLDDALEAIDEALRISPGNSNYWQVKGAILRSLERRVEAISSFQQALRHNPTNFEARDAMRDLEGKGSAFVHFGTIDLAALIKSLPPSATAKDDALIVLDDMKRVVYEPGATEYVVERVYRVHTSRGIDRLKEHSIGYNSYLSRLIIERAVTIKSSGSEIKADIQENQIIYKSLEAGDLIHLKYRLRSVNAGLLSEHFSDEFYFSQFYPVRLARYAVITPASMPVHHRTQMMEDAPEISQTPDGVLTSWTVEHEPAVQAEPSMPLLVKVGKMLFLSTIASWGDIAEWYRGVSLTKTRSTHEISSAVSTLLPDSLQYSQREKATRICEYVRDAIRYSSVSFRQSGLVPQKARDVLATRIGDCKDLTALSIAMLSEAGIPAWFVLVSTRDQAHSPNILPSLTFNHAIVGMRLGSDTVYADPTAKYVPFGSLADEDVGGVVLHVTSGTEDLGSIPRAALPARTIRRMTEITIRDDRSARIASSDRRDGSALAPLRSRYRDEDHEAREKAMQEWLEGAYPGMILVSFDLSGLEAKAQATTQSYVVDVPQYVTLAERLMVLKSPWTYPWSQWSDLSPDKRKYPLEYQPDLDTLVEEMTIRLPKGYTVAEKLSPVIIQSTIADYSTELRMEKGAIVGRRQIVFKKDIVEAHEYAAFKRFYNDVVINENKPIVLKKK